VESKRPLLLPSPLDVLRRVQVYQELLARAALSLPPGAKALELGCGNGLLVDHLSSSLARYTGLDPSAKAIGTAIARYGDRPGVAFRMADLATADLGRDGTDAVLHLGLLPTPALDPVGLVRRARSALGPGGRIIISGTSSPESVLRASKRILEQWGQDGGDPEDRPAVERWLDDHRCAAAHPSNSRSVEGMDALLHHLGFRRTLEVATDLFYGSRYLVVAEA
jgi:SAM-dependent methyltransferase